MEFFPEVQVSRSTAEAIARGLFEVARADGVHERETALIASFWIETGGEHAGLADLERRGPIGGAELAAALGTDEERQLFLKTALLLAWADGKVTPAENKVVTAFAGALGLSDRLETLETQVKEYLLGHVAHLHNTDAAVAVARRLGV